MKIVHIREHGGRRERERDRKEERGRREETVDAVFVRHEQSAKKRKTAAAAAADEELFLQKRGRRWQTPTRTCGKYLSKVCRCNLNQ